MKIEPYTSLFMKRRFTTWIFPKGQKKEPYIIANIKYSCLVLDYEFMPQCQTLWLLLGRLQGGGGEEASCKICISR